MINKQSKDYVELVRQLCSPKCIYMVLLGALGVTGLVVWFLHKSDGNNPTLLCAKYFIGLVALAIVGGVLFILSRKR